MTNVYNENGAREIFFKLKEDFVNKFKWKQPNWGPMGYVTYKRTYSRDLGGGKSEEYWQTVRRVVEGVFTVQKRHCHINNLPWSEAKAQRSAQKMYQLMWEFKFTPAGRGLWMMGTDAMYDKGVSALLNCSFISTENINIDFAEPFTFMMDMSMLGVGVGSDVRGAGKITIKQPKYAVDTSKGEEDVFVVPDTREGWVELLRTLLNAFVGKNPLPTKIDYSQIRKAGEPIKGFGGTASGPEPLMEMYDNIYNLLMSRVGQKITTTDIVDIHNFIGRCVVSGNIRRTAQIIFGEPNDDEFLNLKNPELFPEELTHRRWASNNSVFATVGMDYSKVAGLTAKNGEPGYVWLENTRNYSRMIDPPDYKDTRVMGVNPCFVGDTVVATADGRNGVTIKQLADESSGKDPVYVYSAKKKNFSNQFGESETFSHWKHEIKKAVAFKTGTKEVIEVILSDGSSFKCTPDHLLATKDGRYIEAQYSEGQHLQNFYSFTNKNTEHSYRHINTISDGHHRQYRMMWEYFNGKYDTKLNQLHHINSDATNDSLENLTLVSIESHKKLTKRYGEDNPIHKCDKEYLRYYSGISNIKANASRYGWSEERKNRELEKYFNTHKEVKREDKNVYMNNELYVENIIFTGETQDVYDLTVEDNNNFFIITNTDDDKYLNSSGILVHNCAEQALEDRESCNLVETYPVNHDNLDEWIETLKYAYMYAKTVTLLPSHNTYNNSVMFKNRRIGTSVTGIVQAFKKFGRRETLKAFDRGYKRLKSWDSTYSDWLCIPKSIKISTVKPSGTTSLLPGVTPGIHYPISEYYIRNIRFQEGSPLLEELKKSGYKVEKDKYSPNTYVVSFPVKEKFFDKSIEDVTMWEQLQNAADLQKYWSDNAVSVTISFSDEEASKIADALEMFEDKLKGVSFLPKKLDVYKQAPYIPISKEEYEKMVDGLERVRVKEIVHDQTEKFCDGTSCEIEY